MSYDDALMSLKERCHKIIFYLACWSLSLLNDGKMVGPKVEKL